MKRLYIPIVITSLLSSCSLDVIPENALTYTNAFLTERDLNTTTTNIHLHLSKLPELSTAYDVGTLADEITEGKDFREWSPIAVTRRNVNWKPHYDAIYTANLLLDNIYRTEGISDERRNYHRGQALFAKGFCYFSLSQHFGTAVVTEDSKRLTAYPLSSIIQVIDASIAAAEEGYNILPVHSELSTISGAPVPNKQFASKGSCAALLAHAYAWKGSLIELLNLDGDAQTAYQKSIEYASKLMDGSAGNYTLLSSVEELCKAISNPTQVNSEDIFLFAFDRFQSEYSVSPSPYTGYVGWPIDKFKVLGEIETSTNFRLYKSTAETLYPDEEDQRRQAFFYKWEDKHEVDDKEYALLHKYREGVYVVDQFDPNGGYFRSLNANYNYWRLADLILLRAECLAKLGRNAEAEKDLNMIRVRAGAKPYPAPHDKDLKAAIFNERERELIGESNHRYFDIVRNNYISTKLEGKFKTLTPTDMKNGALFLPIPISAYQDKSGQITNTLIIQSIYWNMYVS
ncbi:RagB/SusD family nutrient uptake outer membrane protein [Porphyromonas sp.]|uniref:RagB/SusD family nutrient uptake outer membrane protein n=1 Tax=Porphyromonas sp. TaxID=1924944 RepID=UPI0026DC6AC6|nr:RagB/SusD family nutrient uptake outer membrane protein [Porphyromonas sp.]MDO4771514.1 RagB/SusD family nutrient uptake outer membrane protein [Porphyromonas sp.]